MKASTHTTQTWDKVGTVRSRISFAAKSTHWRASLKWRNKRDDAMKSAQQAKWDFRDKDTSDLFQEVAARGGVWFCEEKKAPESHRRDVLRGQEGNNSQGTPSNLRTPLGHRQITPVQWSVSSITVMGVGRIFFHNGVSSTPEGG